MTHILDGKSMARDLREQLRTRVAAFLQRHGRPPGLAVLLVGDDPASHVYVQNKEKAAHEIGLFSEIVRLPQSATQADVLQAVTRLNAQPNIDGFLVQMPLPGHLDDREILLNISPEKDADGLHPLNLGRLLSGLSAPRSCTPAGVMHILRTAGVACASKRAVVIGRSTIVGKPMAMMLLEANATVTICHSKSLDIPDEVRRSDIVIAAVGKPEFVRGEWIQPGAVVIDVGINRVNGKLVGDVEFSTTKEKAAAITPVPGGVGPMTVAMLLQNTVGLAERALA